MDNRVLHPVSRFGMVYVVLAVFLSLCGCQSSSGFQDIAERESARLLDHAGETLEVYIHGAGDDPASWGRRFERDFGGTALDWSELSGNRLGAPNAGYALGRNMGEVLVSKLGDFRLLLVAHSAGSWVAQGMIDAMAAQGVDSGTRISLVLLDPFTARSLFQPFAGSRQLGLHANAVYTYYTTVDPIPFTSGAVAAGERIDWSERTKGVAAAVDAHWQVINLYHEDRIESRMLSHP